jgi:hypothetical protein
MRTESSRATRRATARVVRSPRSKRRSPEPTRPKNALIIDSLAAVIERVRADKDFTSRARELLKCDKELSDRLAR